MILIFLDGGVLLFADIFNFFRIISMHFSLGVLQPIFWAVIFLTYIMYRKMIYLEQSILGQTRLGTGEMVFESVMHGILVGFIISLIINYFGIYIQIDINTFIYLWMVVLLLAFVNVRYLCFAYAGGILALTNLIFGWPQVDVSGLLALVGLLHFAEAFLILLNGHKNAIPVFVRQKEKVVGAFFIQKFWPIPIGMLLMQILLSSEMPTEVISINNPHWWPLMKVPEIFHNQTALFSILTIPAILGYSDIAVSDPPTVKAKSSGIFLGIYSIILVILAVASSHINSFRYIAAVFAPGAHEALIIYWKKRQAKRTPFFSVPDKGVRVLDVFEGGPAYNMGILPGDIILKINNKDIMTYDGIMTILKEYPNYIWVDVLRGGKHFSMDYKNYIDGIDSLKIIIVPRDGNVANILNTSHNKSLLFKLFKKITTNSS